MQSSQQSSQRYHLFLGKLKVSFAFGLLFAPFGALNAAEDGKSLATVIAQGMSSIDVFRGSPEKLESLSKQADRFIQFRNNIMSAKDKLVWIGDCFSNKNKSADPFCEYTIYQKARVLGLRPDPKNKSKKEKGYSPFEVANSLKLRQWGQLKKYTDRELINASKKLGGLKDIEPIFSDILAFPECLTPQVYSTMGIKAEEFFPDPAARQWSLRLYDRSINCTKVEDESTYKARYRLALLYIAEDRFVAAAPLLETVAKSGGEYESRAYYWRYYCALKLDQPKIAEQYRKGIIEKFPLSYHVLLMDEGAAHELSRIVRARDPKVQFRSTKKSDLNILIHAVDVLIQKDSHRLARELLDYIVEESAGAEVEFRLYLAVLFHRLDETLENFKLLAGIFKEHPQYVSNTTLELFYPLRRFEIMKKYKDKLDPLLAASIIRQESAFKERARSRVGAMGLMQLMPATARRMERVSRRELYDPHTNIRLGMKFYSKMVEKFGGDGELALAAYNAGPDKIDFWKRRYPTANRSLFMDLIPYKETREYVATIGRNYFWYLTLYEAKMNPSSSSRSPASVLGAPIPLKRELNKHRPDFSFFKP